MLRLVCLFRHLVNPILFLLYLLLESRSLSIGNNGRAQPFPAGSVAVLFRCSKDRILLQAWKKHDSPLHSDMVDVENNHLRSERWKCRWL